jgi:sarcosine dehydrogenase
MDQRQDAEIIIIGGGIIGCSIAYHLARMGKSDVIVLEKSQITHGATWHAAGLVGQLRSSRNTTRMLQKSVALYDQLEAETGQVVDWKKVGSLRLACSQERMLENRRLATMAKSFGLEMHNLSTKEALDLFPLMSEEGLLGAVYLPSDGHIDPSSVTQALAKGARMRGAKFVQGIRVEDVIVHGRRVQEVVTDRGNYRCDMLVNAAGMWAHQLGKMAGVSIPACALEHQFLVTEPIPDMPRDMPTMRDPDHLVYYKAEVDGLAVGGYEPNTCPFGDRGIRPDFGQELLPENFDRFEQLALQAAIRTPILNKVGVRKLINGPIPYSADGDFVMGKAPELDNYFVASGFLYGIAAGGGAGQMMAEWIVEGRPSLDLWPLDIRRFADHHATKYFMFPRAVELYGKHYTLNPPGTEHHSVRKLRLSPLYHRLQKQGAVYGSKAGWERPNWFAPPDVEPVDRPSYQHPNWFEYVGSEHRAVRERVALIDQTSFGKFEVKGPHALKTLQWLADSNLNRPVGTVTYTQLCNERGGIEADMTVARLAEDSFYIVTGSSFGTHDMDFIRLHMPADGTVYLDDVTSSRAVINLCGPQARQVLEKVCQDDVTNDGLKFGTFKEIHIGAAPVRALRISYVGELGWELHIPTEFACHVYQLLWEAGQEFGIANVGYRAIDTLRMEKGYLYWSTDITPDYNPYEAGLGQRVHLKKGPFLGRDALVQIQAEGVTRKLCTFTLEQPATVFGGEAILCNSHVLGVTTSANFGHTVGKPILFGYIPIDQCVHTDFQIEVAGESYDATRHEQPLYDPQRKRILG